VGHPFDVAQGEPVRSRRWRDSGHAFGEAVEGSILAVIIFIYLMRMFTSIFLVTI